MKALTYNIENFLNFLHVDVLLKKQKFYNQKCNVQNLFHNPSQDQMVILQDLPRFLQKKVILQDLAGRRLSCKILQEEWLSCKFPANSFRSSSAIIGCFRRIIFHLAQTITKI